MAKLISPLINSEFAKDVVQGLTTNPKYLRSKYFYDYKGDQLFQQIMNLPEYYLTDSELEILENNKEKLLKIMDSGEDFNLIDLGAGDAFKTRILLKHYVNQSIKFTYVPVDISQNAIQRVTEELQHLIPDLKIEGISKEYLPALDSIPNGARKIILFLGASIGNFSPQETILFLKRINQTMHKEDLLTIGFDLKKDPDIILNAYNDKSGVTKEFNLNLLNRINTELGANFNLNSFEHSPRYDIEKGEARSALISKKNQMVEIPTLKISVSLKKGEPIHTEISRKFSLQDIKGLAEVSGYEIVENLMDSKNYFTDSIWKKAD
ncbi:L-histidine N(alpha)-methyltransferase [Salegentibacter sp. JZCK2]|uniref:L-histidine N(alpha)-methyltransferase n=1 Tax=Salegentibacter tibetensis TaxID=2873600 RepID=UPI001CCEE93F|nr:L-histidine N(alpha)-methyltransferase [Salegentibacter tibetensis]MBZ9731622.1 L-histidine N(alpha)-methyltransferase [Salegentibacter tibetensis]